MHVSRYLGFSPDDLDSVPYAVVDFVARQLEVPPEAITPYGRRIPTRTAHLQQVQAYLAFRKATPLDWEILAAWLLERALEHDKPTLLLQLACEKLLRDRIVRPGISRLERMVATARQDAQQETFRRLAPLLEQERCAFLDQLLIPDQMGRTPLTWLREGAKSNSAEEILNAVKKLDFLREAGVEGWDMTAFNPNRLKFLAQIGRKATNQYLQRANEERRYPILLALLKQSLVDVTDETIEMYDQCLWECYSDARKDLEELEANPNVSRQTRCSASFRTSVR